ncbi:anaphase-promoting complex subunit 2 [Lepeophtheirus salmonis]|uniref:anaphase-promoting complex subunit 2 n=1 Tax=Lepeophtheirus salmonis TaxID=72036 RepID=UPI001AE65B48|nr:anaphase-promoting complex subunit 2-like [Lepeophtheirus salmonis]
MRRLEPEKEVPVELWLKGTLHSQLSTEQKHLHTVYEFYFRAFRVFHFRQERSRKEKDEDDEEEDDDVNDPSVECPGCKNETESCECNSVLELFLSVNKKLQDLGILELLTSNPVTDIVHKKIESHVLETCKGSFIISHIADLENWLSNVAISWIRSLYSSSSASNSFGQRLRHYLYEVYTHTRISQLFNIIIEFPESQPALKDLRECLTKTDLREHLTSHFKKVLENKLLHVGVNTVDILTAYIAAIRALMVLDPSGVLLEIVSEPVRKYLRSREDTVRCIVQSFDDNNSDLAEELERGQGLTLDENFLDEDLVDDNWDSWNPDPVDADPNKTTKSRRVSDIISMLVNIYGSKELFVNEYRSLLSNRLLSSFSYDTQKEIWNLELLKLRFGESPLHQCEVMLKDIRDSKRINFLLHSDDGPAELKNQPFPVNAIVLSAQFWPQFKQENLVLPQEITKALEVYTKAFENLKGNRTLNWKTHLGFANIDIEIGEKKINLTVSPVHAAIIYQFMEKAEWSAEELSHNLQVPVSILRRRMTFWLSQGLIRELEHDKYCLVEEGPIRRMSGLVSDPINEDEETESVTTTSRDQRAEELQVFWSYIVGMLTNLESLPLDRIFQMLKMFAMQGPSAVECSIEELRSFLDSKVRDHQLIVSGGLYKLPK